MGTKQCRSTPDRQNILYSTLDQGLTKYDLQARFYLPLILIQDSIIFLNGYFLKGYSSKEDERLHQVLYNMLLTVLNLFTYLLT